MESHKLTLSDLLLREKLLTSDQLTTALSKQIQEGIELEDVLIKLGYISEETLGAALERQYHVPYVRLNQFPLKEEVIRTLPEAMARRFQVILLENKGGSYLVGMVNPLDLRAQDELTKHLKATLTIAMVNQKHLLQALDRNYQHTKEMTSLASQLADDLKVQSGDVTSLDELEGQGEEVDAAPVIKLLESIFEDAVRAGASDIHIEPDAEVLRIRNRVDGVLVEQVMDNKSIVSALVLRLKLMAKLNISERRLPQDGRLSMTIRGRTIDVRVSTMPTRHGESVVMRLLDQSQGFLDMKQLGLRTEHLEKLHYHIDRPYGMILLTGPTGSGKSTTLYACLNELNKPERKIITVEDPIEFTLPRVCQIQVMPKIGLDFARVLRSALRQDPDVVMVGEIRDEETASIALRSALTGHLVFSTLHTNDAISAPLRLINMGIEPYLVAGTVRLVIAQRLIRRLCPDCKTPHQPSDQEKGWLEAIAQQSLGSASFFSGKGCHRCNHTGYQGRLSVHEFLELTPAMNAALRRLDTEQFGHLARASTGYASLVQCALKNAQEGLSSIQEVLKVANELSASGEG